MDGKDADEEFDVARGDLVLPVIRQLLGLAPEEPNDRDIDAHFA